MNRGYQNYEQRRQKLGTSLEIFKKKFIKTRSLTPIFFNKNFFERFNQFSMMKNDFENQNFETFQEVVHNFGKSDSDTTW